MMGFAALCPSYATSQRRIGSWIVQWSGSIQTTRLRRFVIETLGQTTNRYLQGRDTLMAPVTISSGLIQTSQLRCSVIRTHD